MKAAAKLILAIVPLAAALSCSVKSPPPDVEPPLTFNGISGDLKATEILPTLDTPISEAKNAIWCASFQAMWKELETLAGEPISLDDAQDFAASLNSAVDPRDAIPQESLFVIAGYNQSNLINQIASNMKQKFPSRSPPAFPGILPDSFIGYAFLDARLKFTLPYDQNHKPLVFIQSDGEKNPICSFGIFPKNHNATDRIWSQPRVIFRKGDPEQGSFEFAIDLCSNSFPSQVIVARINREPTLAAAFERVEGEIAAMPKRVKEEAMRVGQEYGELLHQVLPLDTLVVPDFYWAISHHFNRLEGKTINNKKLNGRRIDIAQQDIVFRLDKNGVILKSETQVYSAGVSTDFVFDRPFLVYLKKRGAKIPYFAMWVDNAEVLQKWIEPK